MDKRNTAWKKSRKFGDVYGGRSSPKIPDRIVSRAHSLSPPGPHDETPIFITDNPSRDYFFPVDADDIRRELQNVPEDDWSTITHIWLRRFKKTDYERGEIPLAEFICGSGVRLVVLYPWPTDLKMFVSKKRPTDRQLKLYAGHKTELIECKDGWHLEWELPELKDFYIQTLLFHEIGHNVDWYRRHWSKSNIRKQEEFADQYAYERTTKRYLRFAPPQDAT